MAKSKPNKRKASQKKPSLESTPPANSNEEIQSSWVFETEMGKRSYPMRDELSIKAAIVSVAINQAQEIIANLDASKSKRTEARKIIEDVYKKLFPKRRGTKRRFYMPEMGVLEVMAEEADRTGMEAYRWMKRQGKSTNEAMAQAIQFIMDSVFDAETTPTGIRYKPFRDMDIQPNDVQRKLEGLPWRRPGRKTFKWEIFSFLTGHSILYLKNNSPKWRIK